MFERKPLYRPVNACARGVWRGHGGGDYAWSRHARQDTPTTQGSMHKGLKRGRDYTPLFRFLLSRIGHDWTATYSEAVSRLDRPEPIFRMVARNEKERRPRFCTGENAFFSGLYIDADNRLALVDPALRIEDMEPSCPCCTHTFDGVPFTRKFDASRWGVSPE
jgi:hypothetical protein